MEALWTLHEGRTVEYPSGLVLHKQCDCDGSSSGPRVTAWKELPFTVMGTARMACDLCGKPWLPEHAVTEPIPGPNWESLTDADPTA